MARRALSISTPCSVIRYRSVSPGRTPSASRTCFGSTVWLFTEIREYASSRLRFMTVRFLSVLPGARRALAARCFSPSSLVNELDRRANSGSVRQARIAGAQWRPQGFGQRHVRGIVGGQPPAELPHSVQG